MDLLVIHPLQEFAKCGAAMTVLCFFYRTEFGKSFAYLREKEERIVTKSLLAPGCFENDTLRRAAKSANCLAVAG